MPSVSREEEVLRLVDLYAQREPPTSGVVSRSRLRAWLADQTAFDGMWAPFVGALVERNLWAPWDGNDLDGRKEQQPATYRDVAQTTQIFSAPRPPPIGYAVAAAGTLGFFVFMILSPPGTGDPAYGAFFSIVVAVSGLLHQIKRGRPELSVRMDGRMLHLTREKQTRTLLLQDIEWVDVEWQGMRYVPPGTSHYEQNRFGVVASLRTGERVVLLEHVVRDVALQVCRAIETAVEAPQPRIRIEGTIEEVQEIEEPEPSVIVDQAAYDGE